MCSSILGLGRPARAHSDPERWGQAAPPLHPAAAAGLSRGSWCPETVPGDAARRRCILGKGEVLLILAGSVLRVHELLLGHGVGRECYLMPRESVLRSVCVSASSRVLITHQAYVTRLTLLPARGYQRAHLELQTG